MKSVCWLSSILCLLVCGPLVLGQGFPNERTRYEYSHTAATGNACRFEIGLKDGIADFYWNGKRRKEKLEPAGIQVPKGKAIQYNVYKVVGKDMWFFFPTDTVETKHGKNDYPMYCRFQLATFALQAVGNSEI
jgi:hypothetical protein